MKFRGSQVKQKTIKYEHTPNDRERQRSTNAKKEIKIHTERHQYKCVHISIEAAEGTQFMWKRKRQTASKRNETKQHSVQRR